MTLEKTYDPHAIEQQWYENWESQGYFKPAGGASSYCIMIPPPNVTGRLHMGHAFQDTIMDALIRYHRMCGDNTLWQAGTDHAGIATQMVVERQLNSEGKTRHDVGRDPFIERVWEWRYASGGTITQQLRRMGSSLDWSRERFTMDEGLSASVREVFVSLHEEGLIYRGKRLVNWDPVLHTAVSDLEVVSQEEKGHLWHMRYPLADGSGHLVVATTRPETMLGDTAVAVHPDDERYQSLIGKQVELPLTGRTIPIIADDYVDPEFGTGCVKITPAHDFNDYAMWERHKEELKDQPYKGLINIFNIDAHIKDNPLDDFTFGHRAKVDEVQASDDGKLTDLPVTDLIPEIYHGLDRYEARKKIVEDLQEQGLIENIEEHTLMVPRGDRSHAVIEPYLTNQWFVKAGPLAEPAIRAVENGDIKFVPDNWKNTYFEWMRNIQDWCISRQIWWGHRIPAWYDEQGEVYVGDSEQAVRAKHGLGSDIVLTQDEDVLDTWFSSALWPFSTLGWPNQTQDLQNFYPTNVLVTGFDIIFFWVARMIMMGLKFMGKVPFTEVYIHGLVRDAHGQKMSKSKGNVLDPIDLIDGIELEALVEKRVSGLMQPEMAKTIEDHTRKDFPDGISAFGTDALRFTFASLASTGRDINFDLGRIGGYRNFCNKLWNAARYVLMNVEGKDCGQNGEAVDLSVSDRWIISLLQETSAQVADQIAHYRFDLAAQTLYSFVWDNYCDWYLELSKPALASENATEAEQRGTRQTLVQVLESILRLAHPIMPFITEEIWQRVKTLASVEGETIMTQPYPVAQQKYIDTEANQEIAWIKSFVLGIRKIRSGMNIAPGKPLPVLLSNGSEQDKSRMNQHSNLLTSLARLEGITWLDNAADAPDSATALVGELKILIPMAGLIDKDAELARLAKEIDRLGNDLERIEKKLGNSGFVDKAPPAVVEKERNKAQQAQVAIGKLKEQHAQIDAM